MLVLKAVVGIAGDTKDCHFLEEPFICREPDVPFFTNMSSVTVMTDIFNEAGGITHVSMLQGRIWGQTTERFLENMDQTNVFVVFLERKSLAGSSE